MNRLLGAAAVSVGMLITSATSAHGQDAIIVTGYDFQTHVVSALGPHGPLRLVQTARTLHLAYLPPDPTLPSVAPDPKLPVPSTACRRIASKWNTVVAGAPGSFGRLYKAMAVYGCAVTFAPGATNANGALNLDFIQPAL